MSDLPITRWDSQRDQMRHSFKVYKLLYKRKKFVLAVFFIILEVISLLLDGFGKSKESILLAGFALSAFGFVMTLLTNIHEMNSLHNISEKQNVAVEFAFSLVQLSATFLAYLGTNSMNNMMASILLIVFAVIAAVFAFLKDENAHGCDSSSFRNDYETGLSMFNHFSSTSSSHSLVNQWLYHDNGTSMEVGRHIFHQACPLRFPPHYLRYFYVNIPDRFDQDATFWKKLLVEIMKTYENFEIEFRGSEGNLLLHYADDAENKSPLGDDQWDKLDMGVKEVTLHPQKVKDD